MALSECAQQLYLYLSKQRKWWFDYELPIADLPSAAKELERHLSGSGLRLEERTSAGGVTKYRLVKPKKPRSDGGIVGLVVE